MVAKIVWTADGLWAWLEENPGAVAQDRVRSIARKAQKQAFREWCTRPAGMDVGLGVRFSERGFALLQLTPRSVSYRNRQSKTLGKLLPYTGPVGTTGISPSGTMRNLVLGGGYNISSANNTGDSVTTKMAVSGANILNYPGPKGAKASNAATYRREFLGFDRGGARDAAWIRQRSTQLMWELLTKEINRARKRVIRNANTYSGA